MIVAAAGPAIQLAQSITFNPLNTLGVVTVAPVARGSRSRVAFDP